MAKNNNERSNLILIMDMLISMISSLLAILLVRWLTEPIFQFSRYVLIWMGLAVVGSLAGFFIEKSHKVVIRYSNLHNIGKLAVAIFIKELILLVCVLVNLFNINRIEGGLLMVLLDSLLSFCSLILVRVFILAIADRLKENVDVNVQRMSVMVFGTTDKSVSLLPRLKLSPRYNVVGFISDIPGMNGKLLGDKNVYYCGDEKEFGALCAMLGGIDCILFATQNESEAQEGKLVRWCINRGIHVLLAPKVEEVAYDYVPKHFDVQKDAEFIPDGMSAFERNTKRAADCILSAILIVVFSPLMLVCHIAIRRSDGGPSLYKQERIGRFGRPFYIYKFRTMRTDAEASGPALYAGEDDPRLTKVGKFLRQHHLDELPQLFNVFKGEMAFIGYRPERRYYIEQIAKVDPRYYYLYQIRPGVTSYATLHNGYTDSLDKMVRRLQYDLYYLKNRSWWFDAKVLWETFMNIVFGKKF